MLPSADLFQNLHIQKKIKSGISSDCVTVLGEDYIYEPRHVISNNVAVCILYIVDSDEP